MVFFLLFLLALAGYFYERRAECRFRTKYAPPGKVVQINGYALHLLSMGERRDGLPTVIFEAGHGSWSSCWQLVMPKIARLTRTCAADRAGYGWSADGPARRLPERIVADLHALLETSGERGPYLFVGHSMGAAVARLFATRYPEEVLGMIWVDSAHEQITRYMPFGRWAFDLITAGSWLGALLARVSFLRVTSLNKLIARYPSVTDPRDYAMLLEQIAAPLYLETIARETSTLTTPGGWSGTRLSFGSLPVTMLEAQYPNLPKIPFLDPFWRMYRRSWSSMQDNLAARSLDTRRIKVQSGHNIQSEAPEMVIAAVIDMLEVIKQGAVPSANLERIND